MPCAIPPVDQSASQLGWHDGVFLPRREEAGVVRVRGTPPLAPIFHSGLDFMADEGSPVVVPWPGTVIAKGYQRSAWRPTDDGLGHYVVISHGVLGPRVNFGEPVATMYSQLRDASALNVGDRVEQGALIGYVGRSGLAPWRASRPLLYFQALGTTRFGRPMVGSDWERTEGIRLDVHRDFLQPLGLEREGAQSPGPRIEPWEQTPSWGGRLVQRTECGPALRGLMALSRGLRGLGTVNPQSIRGSYTRYGSTQLSVSTPYAPAVRTEAAAPASGSSGALVLGLGLAAGVWWWMRRGRAAA